MLFQRLIWCALFTALAVGSVQFVVQRWQAVPIVLAAEAYEDQKAEPAHEHVHAAGAVPHEHTHDHGEEAAWMPAAGLERNAWTWVANALNAFAMALLVFSTMGAWVWLRGPALGTPRLALAVAAAGWLSLHLWPSLGLPAEIPGMDAAALGARQAWWVLAAAGAAGACATLAFGNARWRWLAAALLLALPFAVGAPQPAGDLLAGFSGEAHAQLQRLAHDFVWATTWVSLSFWAALGGIGGWVFARWLKPLLASLRAAAAGAPGSAQAAR
jgi:cobalt transporter subunit CbtA